MRYYVLNLYIDSSSMIDLFSPEIVKYEQMELSCILKLVTR